MNELKKLEEYLTAQRKENRKMTNDVKKVLENHKHWIDRDCDGWESMRANLCEANLREANLYGADLRGVNLYGADLYKADLREANLRRADLREADLGEVDLSGANLRGADLREANLRRADLREADLRGTKHVPYIPLICPSDGEFIGWKKAKGNLIVKLRIPVDAKRSSATSRKCRCDKAVVIAIENVDGTPASIDVAISQFDESFHYKVGQTVIVEDFDEDRWNECSTGIHFFINRQEAVDY